jgi:hypothetical protein
MLNLREVILSNTFVGSMLYDVCNGVTITTATNIPTRAPGRPGTVARCNGAPHEPFEMKIEAHQKKKPRSTAVDTADAGAERSLLPRGNVPRSSTLVLLSTTKTRLATDSNMDVTFEI